jgi:hypothetical protein
MKHLGKVQGALAACITVGFFAVIWLLMTMEGHGNMRDALLIMVGALGAAFGAIVNYYFGSSSGSAEKTSMLKGLP